MSSHKKRAMIVYGTVLCLLATTLVAAPQKEQGAKPEALELTVLQYEPAQIQHDPNNPVIQEILKRKNVKINLESVPEADRWPRIRTLISTDNLPDVTILFIDMVKEFAPSGIFLPVSDYMADMPNFEKGLKSTFGADLKKIYIGGKLYHLPTWSRYQIQGGYLPAIRVDLLQKYGLSMPQSFDQLYEVLKRFKKEDPSSYPWTNRYGSRYFIYCSVFQMGSTWYRHTLDPDIDGGRFVYGPMDPYFKKILEYHRRNYAEGILDPEFITRAVAQFNEMYSTGKSTFFCDNQGFIVSYNKALAERTPGARFEPVPLMENWRGTRRGYFFGKSSVHNWVVSSKVKRPVETMKFIDWMYSDEGIDLTNFGLEGVHFTKKDGKYTIADALAQKYKDNKDPLNAIASELGTGMMHFTTVFDARPWTPFDSTETARISEFRLAEKGMRDLFLDPAFTPEEGKRIADLDTQLYDMLLPVLEKYIIGQAQMSDWDKVIAQAKPLATEWENIYNTANKRN